jgi:hypothetical protein
MAESKSDRFVNEINSCSGNRRNSVSKSINSLGAVPERDRWILHCYFCGSPGGDHQVCGSPECHAKAGAILRADLDFEAAMWAGDGAPIPPGHEGVALRSRLAVNIATLAAFILIAGIIILTMPFIVFPLTRGMQ